MTEKIKKVGIIGAGVMGSGIAAHLANAGIPSVLLDIIPPKLTEEDMKEGLGTDNPKWRNKFANSGLEKALKSKPASFYSKSLASLVKTGNLEDHLDWLKEVDWVIEVVVEDLKIKQELFAKIEKVIRPGTIVSTNTSGIPIRAISANFSDSMKEHFLGTHFFNPPRYMKLVEIIPGEKTKKEVVDTISRFCEDVLGKGVVICKDVTNFIANRIGTFDLANAMRIMMEKGLTVAELDAIIGKEIGRPGSSICGTIDLVGIDVGYHVMKNLYSAVTDDEMRDVFAPSEFMEKMIERGWLGNKTGSGFYKRIKEGEKKTKLMLDYKTMEYVPLKEPKFESISEAKKLEGGFDQRLKAVFYGKDIAAQVVQEYLCKNFIYSASRIPEITDSIVAIDNAMKWGYNHKLGPFETWDVLGVEEVIKTMENLGLKVPSNVKEMVSRGFKSFYIEKEDGKYVYDFQKKNYIPVEKNDKIIILKTLKEKKKTIEENASASLIDLGDGVACLEFHTKMNTIDEETIAMVFRACDIVENGPFLGLVVANNATNFSVGANIFKVCMAAQMGEWDLLEKMVHDFQYANMRMKFLSKPVVVAPAGMALGGGCEMSMHSAMCQACGETYIGLVEVGVGVIPAGGGTKELMVRVTEGIPDGVIEAGLNLQPFYQKVFENIGMAKVATSAIEAMELGYLRKTDRISINRDYQISDAKEAVIAISKIYKKPNPAMIPVMGENFRGMVSAILYNMRHGNFITDYDVHVGQKLAYVISGGDCEEGTRVSEDYILDLEREAFLSLAGEKKTQDRMMHMLTTGKPLRN